MLRSDLYTCDEAFLTGTAAEVVPIRSVDDREIGEPGPITRKIQETYFATVHGQVESYRAGSNMSDARVTPRAKPSLARAVEIYDTTLRDGSQLEGISLTVDDKLRIAEQLDWLGVALHRGRMAGREPEGRRDVPAGAARSSRSTTSELVAFGSTRRVEGQGRQRRHAAPPLEGEHVDASASSARRGTTTSPRRCRPRSTRAWRWSPSRWST